MYRLARSSIRFCLLSPLAMRCAPPARVTFSTPSRPARRGRATPARASSSAPQDDSTFGRPSAPRDLWEGFAVRFRTEFLTEARSPTCDPARAALLLAAEDDAVASRTAVPLPVDSYVGRVDTFVNDFTFSFAPPPGATLSAQAEALDSFLYTTCRFRLPTAWAERHSPYRTYLHHVLAQRVGVSPALGLVHAAVLARLQANRVLDAGLALDLAPGGVPKTVPLTLVRHPVSTQELLLQTLDCLSRAFWPWPWPVDSPSGFLPAARAAVAGPGGDRIGRVAFGKVSITATGRPFGDLERAQMALERSVALSPVTGLPTRDLGTLLAHTGSVRDALSLLLSFRDSDAGRRAAAAAAVDGAADPHSEAVEEAEALEKLVLELERAVLELTFAEKTGEGA